MSKKKTKQLGMNFSTAQGRLRKNVMFALMIRCGLNNCHQCGEKIENPEDLSIEHKIPWLDSEIPRKLFWDLDNLAFSHLSCNSAASKRPKGKTKHGTINAYERHGCRCDQCCVAKSIKNSKRDRPSKH